MSSNMTCTIGHPELKADVKRLRVETSPHGVQVCGDETLWLRNCGHCQSTIVLEVDVDASDASVVEPRPSSS